MPTKTELAREALRADPAEYDRAIARRLGVSNRTVSFARHEMEKAGEIQPRAKKAPKTAGTLMAGTSEPPHKWPLAQLLTALDGALDEALADVAEAPGFDKAVLSAVLRKGRALRNAMIDQTYGAKDEDVPGAEADHDQVPADEPSSRPRRTVAIRGRQ